MISVQSSQKHNLKSQAILFVKIILVAAVFYFLYLQVNTNWADISSYDWEIASPAYLALSFAAALFSLFLFSSTWSLIVRGFGHRLRLPVAFKISYISNLGRYLPGKIWQLFGIIYFAREHGLSPEKATASFIISQIFMSASSFLILAIAVQIEPLIIVDQIRILGEKFAYLFTALMIIISFSIIIWPNRILSVCNYILKKLSRPELTFVMDKKVAPVVFAGYCVAWIFYGGAFWLLIQSLAPQANLSLISAIGIFAGAYQIGYLALFAPGGFGPREWMMSQMLMPFLPGIAPIIAILSRLWTIVIEIAAMGLSLTVKK